MKFVIATLALLICAAGTRADQAQESSKAPNALATIASLDVPRYMGTWYEVAKYPNRFQKMCTSDTRAEYQLQPDGKVQVINRCRLANGEMTEALGAARQIGSSQSPRLEVRFAPAWLSFIPMVWGSYWVIDLDTDYQLAAVSEPKREFLWILSRTPQPNPAALQSLLARLTAQGFDLTKIETSRQTTKP